MKVLPWSDGVFIIAEAGVNHNGQLDLAKKLIDGAKTAGADAVKFQTWVNSEIMTRSAEKVEYIQKNTNKVKSMWDIAKDLCLSFEDFEVLQAYANKVGILFLSTADGFQSLNFLADKLQVPILKIGSTEVNHPQYLEKCASKNRPIILSTGLSTLGEVDAAIRSIRKSYDGPMVLLHCNSAYPTPDEDVNLKAMVTLGNAFNLPVGFSDHSEGVEAAISAVALGACVVEKHFTLDRKMEGPDHSISMDVAELTKFVKSIRKTQKLLGDGRKIVTCSESKNRTGVRRSVVAKVAIPEGTLITEDMLICKRPGTGIAPVDVEKLVGLKARKTFKEDEVILWQHFK